MQPLVSVILPVFNTEKYVAESIQSILDQTFTNFELIIINDGSTDNTASVVKKFNDQRIVYVENSENKGLIFSLNRGIDVARSDIIARMDADDVAVGSRLKKQYEFLLSHPEYGMVSSLVRLIDEEGNKMEVWKDARHEEDIFYKLHFVNVLYHSTVMFRRKLVQNLGGYDKEALHMEDYDLWLKLSKKTKIFQLDEILIFLRMTHDGICHKYKKIQHNNVVKTVEEELKKSTGKTYSDKQISAYICNRSLGFDFKLLLNDLMEINKSILNSESNVIENLGLNIAIIRKSMDAKIIHLCLNFIRFSSFQEKQQYLVFALTTLLLKSIDYLTLSIGNQ